MSIWLQFALVGLGTGAVYALSALGLVLVYRSSGVLNFASGAIGAVGAFVFYELHHQSELAWPLAMVIGILTGAVLALAVNDLVLSRLRSTSTVVKLIATLGVFTLLTGAMIVLWGDMSGTIVPSLLPTTTWHLSDDLYVTWDRVILLAIGVTLTLALSIVYGRTRFGMATTAVAESRRGVASIGWSATAIERINWAVGGALAALAGILLSPIVSLDVNTISLLVIPALAAALIGGFSSFRLTLLGALLIGVLEAELSRWNNSVPGLSGAVPFVAIVLVMVAGGRARPTRGDLPQRLPLPGTGRVSARGVLVGLAAGLLLAAVLSPTYLDAFTTTLLAAIVIVSIVVVTGYAGQLSLGQWALAGFGAWISGRAADGLGLPFAPALVLGVLATVPAGLVFALPALRTRGVNLAIVTIGMALVIQQMILGNADLTGGIDGTSVGDPDVLGLSLNATLHPERYAVVALLAFIAVALVAANLRRGSTGLRLLAVRSNERAAAALGINVYAAKLYAFAVAAGIAAVAGSLIAFRQPSVVYSQFDVMTSIQYVVLAIVGGIGWIGGAIPGALLASGSLVAQFVESLIDFDKWVLVIGGLSVIGVLAAYPMGIGAANADSWRMLTARLGRRRADAGKPERAAPVIPRRAHTPVSFEVEEVSVRYGAVEALTGATFSVRPGQVVGLIGPNGAGKTTLLDAVTGFAPIAGGRVRLGGQDITRWTPNRRARAGIGRSWQTVDLFDELTVRENLQAALVRSRWVYATDLLRPGRVPSSEMLETVAEEFHLTAHLDQRPSELPQGTRRLVGIARALVGEPAILLLDEPAAGLDDQETGELGHLVRRIVRDYEISIVIVEHDVPLVMSVCDYVVVLENGRVLASGTPQEVRQDPLVVEAYLGTPDDPAPEAAAGGVKLG